MLFLLLLYGKGHAHVYGEVKGMHMYREVKEGMHMYGEVGSRSD